MKNFKIVRIAGAVLFSSLLLAGCGSDQADREKKSCPGEMILAEDMSCVNKDFYK
jgi:hypothetical protein